MIYSEYDGLLFAYANQIIAFDYNSRKIKYIINNWPSPLISFKGKALRVY